MKMMWMFAFLALPLAAIAYCAWHVWALLPWGAVPKSLVVGAGIVAFLLLFANLGRGLDGLPLPLASACYEVGTSSIFVLLYLFMAFVLLDVGRLVRLVPRTWLHGNGTVAAVLAALLVGLFAYGNLHYRHKVRQTLQIDGGGKVDRPLKLVLLSDLHLGYHNRRAELARWVDLLNAEHADAVLIAGDIIDGSLRPLAEERMADELRRLQAPIYACLGNHEYFAGPEGSEQFYRAAGIRLLRDEVATLGPLAIIGRDDRTNGSRQPLAQLARLADSTRFTVLLDHQPYQLDEAERAGIDFQFSGHTHHGQVWPISWITDAIYECAFGAHQRGHTRYYVSSGMGIWGGKFRIGTRSEYVVATIE